MASVRRSLLLASGENYVTLVASIATLAIASRLLTPTEIGVYGLGAATMAIALAVREFATSEILVQRATITSDDMRTCFTLVSGLSLAVAVAAWFGAPAVAYFYGLEGLAPFIQVAVVGAVVECFALPLIALLRREMEFGKLATIRIVSALIASITICGLAWLGFSYMSFAWATVSASGTTALLAICFRPELGIFRPSLRSWRTVLSFGGYNGATNMLGRSTETIPLLVLGRLMPVSTVGLYNRATVICLMPDRIILAGLFSIALPALSKEIRAGRSIKEPYLKAITLISAAYWPAQTLLVLLAFPLVYLALGPQWEPVVPLVQIIALSTYVSVLLILTQPVLVSVGAFRDYLFSTLITTPFAIAIFSAAAFISIEAFAASYLITLPVQVVVQQYFIRKHIDVSWSDIGAALAGSAVVNGFTALGPLLVIAHAGFDFQLSLLQLLVAGALAGLFWLVALYITRHPFLDELCSVAGFGDTASARLRLSQALGRILSRQGNRSA